MLTWLQVGVDGVLAALFVLTLVHAIRRPDTGRWTVAAFFFAILAGILVGALDDLGASDAALPIRICFLLVNAVPWLFVRMAGTFRPIPRVVSALALSGFAASVVIDLANVYALVGWISTAYFVAGMAYASWVLFSASRTSSGVPLHRLRAISVSGILIALATAFASTYPSDGAALYDDPTLMLLELALVVSLYLGFATPRFLRRWWEAAEVERFLRAVSETPPNVRARATVEQVPMAAMRAVGGSWAGVALREPSGFIFRSSTTPPPTPRFPSNDPISLRVFEERRVILVTADDPDAPWIRQMGAEAVILAPLMARGEVIGLLNVFLRRPPMFADDAVRMVQLLAEQTALAQEQVMLVDELHAALARGERLAVLGTLVASVAHETNNILTYARGHVDLVIMDIADGRPIEAESKRDLERVVKGLDSVVRLTRSLKSATREGSAIARDPVDLNAIVASVLDLLATSSPSHVGITAELDANVAITLASESELEQVVLNLAKNAIEALGDRAGHVLIATRSSNGLAEVSVTDDGPGVPTSAVERLFEPFRTTKKNGTGLGLSISRRIAREHGGDLVLDAPVEGKGATFRLRVPAATVAVIAS